MLVEIAEQFLSLWLNLGALHCALCCTAGSFQIDISGGPCSPWNKSVAKVFANSFICAKGFNPDQDTTEKTIVAFHSRIQYEQQKYKVGLLSESAKEKIMSNRQRDQRQYSVGPINYCGI